MNTVLSNYGQLCGCPEILKKSCNFFVVGLTYGCRRSCKRILFTPDFSIPLTIQCSIYDFVKRNSLSCFIIPYR